MKLVRASAVARLDLRRDLGRLLSWVHALRDLGLDQPHHEESLALTARLTPLDAAGLPDETRDVCLQAVSERKIAFDHLRPLANRRAMFLLEGPNQGRLVAEVDLSWCRYRQGGGYTSGGRLVQVYQLPE
jgi:hypothetical protein